LNDAAVGFDHYLFQSLDYSLVTGVNNENLQHDRAQLENALDAWLHGGTTAGWVS
jgi:hypothetical protein